MSAALPPEVPAFGQSLGVFAVVQFLGAVLALRRFRGERPRSPGGEPG